jgi:hypothetical protein
MGQSRFELRSTSKRLFNSQYRIEVAELIGSLGDPFTTQDLNEALNFAGGDLPWSCVTKELAVLVSVGLVGRSSGRSSDGRIPYSPSASFPAFLGFLERLNPPSIGPLVDLVESNITPIHRKSADH